MKGPKKFSKSLSYAFQGIKMAFKKEKNLRIHFACAILAIFLAYFLDLSMASKIAVVVAIAMVISAELFNTAIECAVDLITEDYHELAKAAKDAAAAGVLVTAIAAFIIGLMVFLKPLIALVKGF